MFVSSFSKSGRVAGSTRSRRGVINGGSPTMRGSPSTIVVSLAKALIESLVRAFSSTRSRLGMAFWPVSALRRSAKLAASRWAYQTSSSVICAKLAHRLPVSAHRLLDRPRAVRRWRTRARARRPRCWRPSRLMSHSQGPGSVSSKSFTSKTRSRSGEAYPPKLRRWASPQHLDPQARRRGVPPGRRR